MEILNPVAPEVGDESRPLPGLATLAGKTLALLDNRHPGVTVFMGRLRQLFEEQTELASVLQRIKPSISKPCPPDLAEELIARSHLIVTGIGT